MPYLLFQDVGQKDFGHVKCDTCGMVYTKSQEEDEEQHAKYHQKIVQKLRFNVPLSLCLFSSVS